MTQREPIKSGDAGDVDHLALVLPIAGFVLTDNRMERRVRELGLEKKWGSRVLDPDRPGAASGLSRSRPTRARWPPTRPR